MGRPRTFDTGQAVHAAMLSFWRHGYTATSVRDLCGAMGLQSGSFYAAFGSKAGLFRQALDHYVHHLALDPPGPEAVVRYLDGVIADREPRGCLLAVSALDPQALDPDARAALDHGLLALETYLGRCLAARPDPRADAAWLSTTAWGLQLRHRVGQGTPELRPIVDRTLEILDIPRSSNT